ncbi:MAG: (Fe-S)-binding protein [Candidatus Schekmanbacteria bacterium]|nr:(Fe-S)-binding protein [Candidatus Schekmanbacteria bacterium]
MAEEYCYPFNRNKLGDYYEMLWRCAKCGYCRNVFPSDTEHERFGRQCPPGERFRFEAYYASGRNEMTRRLIEGKQELTERLRHILYTCTTCNACEEWCSATQGLYTLKIIMELRKYFVEHGGDIVPQHRKIIQNLEKNYNRVNRNNKDRLGWLPDKGRGIEKADVVYFVGCRSSFRRIEIAKSAYELLTEKLGLKVSFIEDERCCGRPLLEIGKEEMAIEFMQHNVEKIKESGASQVFFTCAECFHNFNILESFGIKREFETTHISQFLALQLKSGKLSLEGMGKRRITFHDPCYLGRHEGVYEDPRELLSAIPGSELVEMPRNRKNAWCCGAGGGVKEAFIDYAQWIAQERMEEIKSVNADLLITSCPGCKENLWGKAKANQVEILDLAELINRTVKG